MIAKWRVPLIFWDSWSPLDLDSLTQALPHASNHSRILSCLQNTTFVIFCRNCISGESHSQLIDVIQQKMHRKCDETSFQHDRIFNYHHLSSNPLPFSSLHLLQVLWRHHRILSGWISTLNFLSWAQNSCFKWLYRPVAQASHFCRLCAHNCKHLTCSGHHFGGHAPSQL